MRLIDKQEKMHIINEKLGFDRKNNEYWVFKEDMSKIFIRRS